MNYNKKSPQLKRSNSQRLLLGLTFALAASLCVLEYGKPLMARYISTGLDDGEALYVDDELPPLTFPKTKAEPKPAEVIKPSTQFEIVPDEVADTAQPRVEPLPEFEFNDEAIFVSEHVVAPEIPLESWMLDAQPEFQGGVGAMMQYVMERVRYPAKLRDQGVQGRVMAEFVVTRRGEINPNSIKITQSVNPGFNQEVKRVIASMPDWKPGKKNGRYVDVTMRLPVVFSLER